MPPSLIPSTVVAVALTGALLIGCASGDAHGSDVQPRPAYATLERVALDDDWFEVYRLPHDVFAINEPHQFQEIISYLILGQRQALLFDTGMVLGDLVGVVDALTELPVRIGSG